MDDRLDIIDYDTKTDELTKLTPLRKMRLHIFSNPGRVLAYFICPICDEKALVLYDKRSGIASATCPNNHFDFSKKVL
jgi:transcription elongation factor Elf1